jgi:hypothetical protein
LFSAGAGLGLTFCQLLVLGNAPRFAGVLACCQRMVYAFVAPHKRAHVTDGGIDGWAQLPAWHPADEEHRNGNHNHVLDFVGDVDLELATVSTAARLYDNDDQDQDDDDDDDDDDDHDQDDDTLSLLSSSLSQSNNSSSSSSKVSGTLHHNAVHLQLGPHAIQLPSRV